MCSQSDDPSQYDIPLPQRPRTYRLSGNAPEPRPSVALAVIGAMLEEEDTALAKYPESLGHANRRVILQEARDRVAAAEAVS